MSKTPKIICWPTTTHVLDPETGGTYRVWRGKGLNGTSVELLVRSVGVSRKTEDKDGIKAWFDTDGFEFGDIIFAGDIPPTLEPMPSNSDLLN